MKKLLYSLLIVFILPCMLLFTGCGEKRNNNVYYTLPTLEHITVDINASSGGSDSNGVFINKNQEFQIIVATDEGYEFESAPIAYINGAPITLNNEGDRYASEYYNANDFSRIDVTVNAQAKFIVRDVTIIRPSSNVEHDTFVNENYELILNNTLASLFGVTPNVAHTVDELENVGGELKYGDVLQVEIKTKSSPFAYQWDVPFSSNDMYLYWNEEVTDDSIVYTAEVFGFTSETVNFTLDTNQLTNNDKAYIHLSVEILETSFGLDYEHENNLFSWSINGGETLSLADAQKTTNKIIVTFKNYTEYQNYFDNMVYEINYEPLTKGVDYQLGSTLELALLPLKEYGDPFAVSVSIKNLVEKMVEDNKLLEFDVTKSYFNDTKYDDATYRVEAHRYDTNVDTNVIDNYYFNDDVVLSISINCNNTNIQEEVYGDTTRYFVITATTTDGQTKTIEVGVDNGKTSEYATLEKYTDRADVYKLTIDNVFLTDVDSLSFDVAYLAE